MDSLTQIVLGAAVGEAVLGKKVGNKALLWGAVAGTIPDLDVIARFLTDTITATEMHRGFSHSILFSILAAPLFGWLVSKIHHKLDVRWKDWAWLFFWGFFTHPLLDAFTTWGTQLFWPWDWRLAFNSIFVIDPLYTVPFLVCVVWVLFKKRGSPDNYRDSRKRINNWGLYLSTGYLLLTLVIKFFAHQQFASDLDKQGITYTQISSRPAPLNTILWNANVDTQDAYLVGDYSFFDSQSIQWKSYPKNRTAAQEWIAKPEVQRLIDISEGWYILEQENDDWIFNDLRFGLIPIDPEHPQFVFRYKLTTENNKVIAIEDRPQPENTKAVFGTLWERIKGN